MSFIGDLVKKIPGVSDIGGFVGDLSDAYKENKDWLNPVVSGGTSYLQGLSENKSRSQYADLLRDSLQRDYDSQSANQKAYLEYIGQANAARGAAAGILGSEGLSRSLRSNGDKVTTSSRSYVWKRSW